MDSVLTGQGGRLKILSAGTLQNLSYLYDAAGNVRQIGDTLTDEIQAFGYDNLNRLTSADVTGGPAPYNEGYTYDPIRSHHRQSSDQERTDLRIFDDTPARGFGIQREYV